LPFVVLTVIAPSVPVVGASTVSTVSAADLITAAAPLNFTVSPVATELKFLPLMVTIVFALPEIGANDVITGASDGV